MLRECVQCWCEENGNEYISDWLSRQTEWMYIFRVYPDRVNNAFVNAKIIYCSTNEKIMYAKVKKIVKNSNGIFQSNILEFIRNNWEKHTRNSVMVTQHPIKNQTGYPGYAIPE
jgi:hypothetical protein